jgi:hypothetical protein
MARSDRIVTIRPGAPGDGWDLFLTDLGRATEFSTATAFGLQVRTAATVVDVAASITAAASAGLDTDSPSDVPTFHVEPVAASLALVPAERRPATLRVIVTRGDIHHYDFPAKIVP